MNSSRFFATLFCFGGNTVSKWGCCLSTMLVKMARFSELVLNILKASKASPPAIARPRSRTTLSLSWVTLFAVPLLAVWVEASWSEILSEEDRSFVIPRWSINWALLESDNVFRVPLLMDADSPFCSLILKAFPVWKDVVFPSLNLNTVTSASNAAFEAVGDALIFPISVMLEVWEFVWLTWFLGPFCLAKRPELARLDKFGLIERAFSAKLRPACEGSLIWAWSFRFVVLDGAWWVISPDLIPVIPPEATLKPEE